MLKVLTLGFGAVPNPKFDAWVEWFIKQSYELREARMNNLEHEVVWREDALADDLARVIRLLSGVAKSNIGDAQLLIDLSRNGTIFACWFEAILYGAVVLPVEYKNHILDRLRDEAAMPIYQRLSPGTANGCLKHILFDRLDKARRSNDLVG